MDLTWTHSDTSDLHRWFSWNPSGFTDQNLITSFQINVRAPEGTTGFNSSPMREHPGNCCWKEVCVFAYGSPLLPWVVRNCLEHPSISTKEMETSNFISCTYLCTLKYTKNSVCIMFSCLNLASLRLHFIQVLKGIAASSTVLGSPWCEAWHWGSHSSWTEVLRVITLLFPIVQLLVPSFWFFFQLISCQ